MTTATEMIVTGVIWGLAASGGFFALRAARRNRAGRRSGRKQV